MRTLRLFGCWLWLAALATSVAALEGSFQLNDGRNLAGEVLIASANDAGVQIKVGSGKYERVSWASFSQEDLRKFAEDKKLEQFVEPFIEIPQEVRLKKTEVELKEVPRLERPRKGSLLGALFGSSVGLVTLLLLYAANVYAGYEIATVRAYPPGLVCGVAAVAPIVGPVVFLCLPTRMAAAESHVLEEAPPDPGVEPLGPADGTVAEAPAGLKIAHDEEREHAPVVPQTQVFARGQFTFNKRFFETKFPGFFGLVRRDAEKDLVLVVKTPRGEHLAHRITRIAAGDMHVEVHKGSAKQEVAVTFGEIQEVQLKHKDV